MLWRDIQKLQIVDKGKLTNERVPSLEEVLRESNKHGEAVRQSSSVSMIIWTSGGCSGILCL